MKRDIFPHTNMKKQNRENRKKLKTLFCKIEVCGKRHVSVKFQYYSTSHKIFFYAINIRLSFIDTAINTNRKVINYLCFSMLNKVSWELFWDTYLVIRTVYKHFSFVSVSANVLIIVISLQVDPQGKYSFISKSSIPMIHNNFPGFCF